MQIYVFEDVLCDYTSGMAVIAAESLEQAQALAFKEFGWQDTLEEFLDACPGWQKLTGEYPLPDGLLHCDGQTLLPMEPRVLHHVYGGG